jgi:hypothetical protein
MKGPGVRLVIISAVVLAQAQSGPIQKPLAPIRIDYPSDGSIFPPDIVAPTFLWRDPSGGAATWRIHVTFAGGAPGLDADARGEGMRVGEIDPRAVAAPRGAP